MSSEPLTLRSNDGAASLVIAPSRPPDYWLAALSGEGLQATTEFYEHGPPSIGSFLSKLAADWRGWDGEQRWESLEGDLALAATHNGLGTVSLTVRLRTDNLGDDGWRAQGVVHLDAGTGLDTVAHQAVAFFRP